MAEACSGIVTLIGVLKLISYFGGWDFGIDRMLFRERLELYEIPNRVAPNTALNFVLCGLGLLGLDWEIRRRFRPTQSFVLAAGLISLVAVLGYAYQVLSLFQVGTYIPMALNTALTFGALCLGVLFARPDRGLMAIITSDSSGGATIRRLLPAAILLPAVLGGLRLWGQNAGLFEPNFGLALFVVANTLVFAAVIWFNARALYREDIKRKRAERRLAIQYIAAQVLQESATLSEALPKILRAICETLGWQTSAMWHLDKEANVLRCAEVWHAPAVNVVEFEAVTRQSTFARGIGLPGRVWASGEPAWISDVVRDSNFPRAPLAAKVGLHGALALPIRVGQEVVGVMEFFSREIQEPDDALLRMLGATGSQIGQFIERKRAEEALGQERYLMNMMMDNIPDHIYFKDRESRFLRINKSLATLFHLSDPGQAKGKSDFDFFTREHAQQAFADEQQIMNTGGSVVGKEEKETWPDGSVTWVSSTKECLRDKNGEVMGTFGLSRDITAHKQAQEQLVRSAEALREKNEQMEDELKMARELQMAMLPHHFPKIPREGRETALEFFSFYFPTAAVSGDFFSIIPLSDTSVGVFICDVMGHGVRAALVTAMMRALVEELSQKTNDPGQLLTQINRGLVGILHHADTVMYATAFYAVADVGRGQMLYANAGHPAPLHLCRQLGEVTSLRADGKRGGALGLFDNATYVSSRRPLASQDLVLLFTDGLFEVEDANQEQYSQERLLAAVRQRANLPSKELLSELLREIEQFGMQKEFVDDVCLIGAEVKRLC